ncbi:MAG: MMPL family transporter [Kangiellaceae bacterium]|nr:MMPL family transporter [Kangiellaceae bacterium]
MNVRNKYFGSSINWVLMHPKSIIGLLACFIIFVSLGIVRLQISNDFRVYFSNDNPQLIAFENFEDNYVKSDSATFVVSAKEADLFNQRGLALIETLTERAWLVNSAYRVSSIANYQHTSSDNDEISSSSLFENSAELTQIEIDKIRELTLSQKRLVQSLITADGKLTVIVINLRLDKSQADASLVITEEMEAIAKTFSANFPEFQIENGGSTAFNTTLARAVASDLTRLMPISYLIIFVGLFIFLGRLSGTLAIFALISACLLCTFGLFGWVAPVLTPIAGFAPSILLSIMVADSVHILTNYYQNRDKGQHKQIALRNSLDLNLMPILVTSITTIIGFLGLNFSSSPPYQALGNMVAFGVVIALLFSLLLLPAILMIIPDGQQRFIAKRLNFRLVSNFVIKQRLVLIIIVSGCVAFLAYSIPSNKLTDNWTTYFDDSFPIVKLVTKIDGYLTGVNLLEYSIAPTNGGSIFDPEYLSQLDKFEQWYLQQTKIIKVTSFSQLMKELNQVMRNDQPSEYTIPRSSELAAQYLLFYEFGLPAEQGLDNLITIHRDATRFSVSMSNAGSDELLEMDSQAQQWLLKNAPALSASQATGLGMVFAHIAQRNIANLLLGTLFALVGISLVLMLILKSVRYGLISLIPNIIPAIMAYGLWGLSYGYVDISLSIVACATLGIVVDDTVHFLYKYIQARKLGLSTVDAVHETFNRVGSALLITSIVLSGGFIILAISHMNTSATIGILMAITLLFALIVDFLLLPPLLLYLDKKNIARKSGGSFNEPQPDN